MKSGNETMKIDLGQIRENESKAIDDMLKSVYQAFDDKGNQDPVRNMTEYFISGDPLYITRNSGARNLICRYDKYDLLRLIVEKYFRDVIK